MRELHGVVYASDDFSEGVLKRRAVLFDKFYMLGLHALLRKLGPKLRSGASANMEFLLSRGIIRLLTADELPKYPYIDEDRQIDPGIAWMIEIEDHVVRDVASNFKDTENEVVGICRNPLPRLLPSPKDRAKQPSSIEMTLQVALETLPIPDDTCSWQDILTSRPRRRTRHGHSDGS